MNIFPNKTLLGIPMVSITKDILDTYNRKYPLETLSDIDILKEIYPNIISMLQLTGIKEDRNLYNLICLQCQYWKGTIEAIKGLFNSLGDAISNPAVTNIDGNIRVTIDSVTTYDVTKFIINLTNFIKEYTFDISGEPTITVNSVNVPISDPRDELVKVTSNTKYFEYRFTNPVVGE